MPVGYYRFLLRCSSSCVRYSEAPRKGTDPQNPQLPPLHHPSQAIRTAALVILREKVLRPILAGVGKPKLGRKPSNWSVLDQHYGLIRQDMLILMHDLRIRLATDKILSMSFA
jgi:hypothetical protein